MKGRWIAHGLKMLLVALVAVTALIGTFAACLCRRLWRLPPLAR